MILGHARSLSGLSNSHTHTLLETGKGHPKWSSSSWQTAVYGLTSWAGVCILFHHPLPESPYPLTVSMNTFYHSSTAFSSKGIMAITHSLCLLWTCCSHVSLGIHWSFKAVPSTFLMCSLTSIHGQRTQACLIVQTRIFPSGLLYLYSSTIQALR